MPREDDTQATAASQLPWLSPVTRIADLPMEGLEEGAICFVKDEKQSYVFVDGEWKLRKGAQLS